MVNINSINQAIVKGRSFLKSIQNKNGSWTHGIGRYNEPIEYFSELSLTGQAVFALGLVAESEDLDAIKRGLKRLMEINIKPTDPLQGVSHALLALFFSNNIAFNEKIKKLKNYIEKRQGKKGEWKIFPSTDIIISYLLIHSLSLYGDSNSAKKCLNFLKKCPAKDGLGWSLNPNGNKSFPSFVSNMVECLASCNEPITSDYFKTCRIFLEKNQKKGGGWTSSDYTEGKKPTIYGTALATLALILSSDNPHNSKVESGIKFILENQRKNGGWALTNGPEEIYTTFYSLRVLSFYKYLKSIKFDSNIPKQAVANNAYRNFETICKKRLEKFFIQDFLSSKVLGSTQGAINRRLTILKIINKRAVVDSAEIIDILKTIPAYSRYNKRAYLTQIGLDLEYLKNLKLIEKSGYKYYSVYSLIN